MGQIIDFLNSIIWSKALVFLCLGAGVYFSIILMISTDQTYQRYGFTA